MCRSIKTLHNFAPAATDDEIRASSLQFVRKNVGLAIAGGTAWDFGPLGVRLPRGVADADERTVLALDVDVLAVHEGAGDEAGLGDALALHGQLAAKGASVRNTRMATVLSLSLSSTSTVPSLAMAMSCGVCWVRGKVPTVLPSGSRRRMRPFT